MHAEGLAMKLGDSLGTRPSHTEGLVPRLGDSIQLVTEIHFNLSNVNVKKFAAVVTNLQ